MANRFPLIVDSSNQNIKELPDGDSLLLGDSEKLLLGDGTDLQLYHDGSNSYLANSTGALKLATESSGIAITIGHTTSETTIGDNLVVAGDLSVGGVTLPEKIADTVGAMISSNTETGLSVTYNDSDNTLDFVIGDDSIVSSMLDTNLDIAGTLDVTGVLTTDTNAVIAGTLGASGGSTNGVAISQGAIAIKNGGAKSRIDLYCESNNAHYTRIEAAAHGAYSGNVTATLPTSTGTLALTSDIHTTEELQDIVGAMVSSNTETNITVTYQDADGTLDFVVDAAQPNVTSLGTLTTLTVDDIKINGTQIGHTSDEDSIAIASNGVVTFSQIPVLPANSVDSDYYVDGSIDTAHIGDDQVTGAKIENAVTIATSATSPLVVATTSARITQVAITSSSNAVAWNSVAAANAYHVTTENTTFSAPSNSVEGAVISIELAQGGTPRTIAWNTVFEFAASTAPTVTATANKTDIFTFRYNGSVWQEIGRVQNMAQT
jgi:hypothetical protein